MKINVNYYPSWMKLQYLAGIGFIVLDEFDGEAELEEYYYSDIDEDESYTGGCDPAFDDWDDYYRFVF